MLKSILTLSTMLPGSQNLSPPELAHRPKTSFYKSITSFYIQKPARFRFARTFVALFHQSSKVMQIHILALLFFFQSLAACQQAPADAQSVAAANIGFSASASQSDSVQVRPSATGLIFQSIDGGQTWQDMSAGLPKNVQVQGVFASGSDLFLGVDKGLYRSSSSPLAAPKWEKEILLDATISNVCAGRAGLYASSYGQGLFQKIPGMAIWENLSYALPDKSVRTVLEAPDGAIFVGTDTGIFKSANNGQTWKQVFADGIILNIVASGGVLIAGGRQGVLRSTDGGEHWNYVLNENILAKKTGLIGDRFVTILGTEDPRKINPLGITSRLRASADGGKTWQRMESALGPVAGIYDMDEHLAEAKDIYDIVQVGTQLFCSFDTGIFRSSDQGKTWELVLAAKDKSNFQLAVSGGVLYAVPGGGC